MKKSLVFDKLDADLQDTIYLYLEELGVDEQMGHYAKYMLKKTEEEGKRGVLEDWKKMIETVHS